MWALLISLLPLAISALNCSAYSCHPPGYNYGPTCFSVNEESATMQLCRDPVNSYCPVIAGALQSNCTIPPTPTVTLGNPGASCSVNSDCINDLCTASVCAGNVTGASCTQHFECGVGLYCGSNDTCQAQLPVGSECQIDYQCVNEAGCDKPQYTAGKCVAYYSVSVKDTVQYCVSGSSESSSRLCTTGVCTQNTTGVNGVGQCADNAASLNYQAPCESDDDCVASSGSANITGNCQCGFNPSGDAYCDAFSGDPPSLTVLALTKAHLDNTTALDTCHTLDRFAASCASKTLNATAYASFISNSQFSADMPALLDNDYCTQLIFNDYYYQETIESLSCPSWSCYNLTGETCLAYDEGSNSVWLYNATGLQMYGASLPYCNTSSFFANIYANVTYSGTPFPVDQLPGQNCSTNFECLSNLCTNKICQGQGLGGSCNATTDCNSGYYCNSNKTCANLISAGASGCSSDYDCSLNSGCNLATGTCVQYFSLQTQAPVSCPSTLGLSYLCASSACYLNATTNTGACVPAPKLNATFPKICTANSDCIGVNSNDQVFAGVCSCGFNPYGHSYCQAFPGDSPSTAFTTLYKSITQASNSVNACHTTARYTGDCLDSLSSRINSDQPASVLYYNSTSYGSFLANDACVKSSVNYYYWSSVQNNTVPPEDDDDFAVELAVTAVLLAYLV